MAGSLTVRLTAAGQEAANRARMAEGAFADLRDMTLAHRGLISELAARGGHVTNNVDARQTSNLVNQHMVDVTTHNQVMNLMHTHAQMFGAFMHQQQISQQETQRLLYEHLRRQEEDRQRNSVVIHRMPPTAPAIQYPVYGQGPPPPPPGKEENANSNDADDTSTRDCASSSTTRSSTTRGRTATPSSPSS